MERMLPLLSPAFKSPRGDGRVISLETEVFWPGQEDSKALLLIGPRATCKTSLLFQAGVSAAKEGLHVTFVRPEPLSALPLPVHGMSESDPDSLALLSMRYPSNAKEFTEYLGSLHECPALPDLLIVDDLHIYLWSLHRENGHEGDPYEILARLGCLLEDAADFMFSKGHKSSPQLIVSSSDLNPMHLPIYEKYFKSIATVEVPDLRNDNITVSWSQKDKRVSLGLTLENNVIMPSHVDVSNSSVS